MIALLIAGLLAQLAQPRAVTCPPRAWLEGIARSGAYRCYVTGGTVDDEHPPHTLVASGRLWCLPDEVPVLVDHRRARCRRGRSKGVSSRRDPVLGAAEDYWSWRARILRTLARWDGAATSTEIAEALDADNATDRNGVHKALSRLVADGVVLRSRVSIASGYFVGDQGCMFEYRLRPGAELVRRRKNVVRKCSRCNQPGHYARTCTSGSAVAA